MSENVLDQLRESESFDYSSIMSVEDISSLQAFTDLSESFIEDFAIILPIAQSSDENAPEEASCADVKPDATPPVPVASPPATQPPAQPNPPAPAQQVPPTQQPLPAPETPNPVPEEAKVQAPATPVANPTEKMLSLIEECKGKEPGSLGVSQDVLEKVIATLYPHL